jgi:hypothetical protein
MNRVNRRGFLQMAGAASAALPVSAALELAAPRVHEAVDPAAASIYYFRAIAGVPDRPLPAYASYVLSGHVDRASGTGLVAQTVFAGAPDAMSEIALPGLSRIVRVTDTRELDGALYLTGVVDDRSQLQSGESPQVQMRIDRASGIVSAGFFGSEAELRLQA